MGSAMNWKDAFTDSQLLRLRDGRSVRIDSTQLFDAQEYISMMRGNRGCGADMGLHGVCCRITNHDGVHASFGLDGAASLMDYHIRVKAVMESTP
jgi:hypothetical protein